MTGKRVLALVLLLIAFGGLGASRAFPFLEGLAEPVQVAIATVGAVAGLIGIRLWLLDRHARED
jgi:hypothetical protein